MLKRRFRPSLFRFFLPRFSRFWLLFNFFFTIKGIFLRDITFADVGNEDFVTKGSTQLINFEKLTIIRQIISAMEKYQSLSYNFIEGPTIANFLKNLVTLPDEALYHHSLLCEPCKEL